MTLTQKIKEYLVTNSYERERVLPIAKGKLPLDWDRMTLEEREELGGFLVRNPKFYEKEARNIEERVPDYSSIAYNPFLEFIASLLDGTRAFAWTGIHLNGESIRQRKRASYRLN